MDCSELVRRHPLLFHAAAAGAWPSIRDHGLLPASAIVASGGFPDEVAASLARPRRAALALDHPVLGPVVLRDQTPLRPDLLARVLDGATPEEWLRLLNARVFFWLHERRLESLLAARRSRRAEHDVLVVDTASLLAVHGPRVRLSPVNSGATAWPSAPRRGPHSFQSIEDYPYVERRRTRGPAAAVVELVVQGGVRDVADHVVRVERRRGPELVEVLHPSSR